MDRTELEEKLIPFQKACAKKDKKIVDICIEEAFPGDSSTSYVIKVKAPWVDDIYCYEALEFLWDVLWETTSEATREKIFSIHIIDSSDELHCKQELADKNVASS